MRNLCGFVIIPSTPARPLPPPLVRVTAHDIGGAPVQEDPKLGAGFPTTRSILL